MSTTPADDVLLLLGTNLGDRLFMLEAARQAIGVEIGAVLGCSSCYESEAWGLPDQPRFLNQVLRLSTSMEPADLLGHTQQIERSLGRIRKEKWGARLIDIDILYIGQRQLNTLELQVPHPYLHLRRFTLIPLVELVPDWIHPVLGQTQDMLLRQCPDQGSVWPI
jgi:2-amino-4-hydroxy-6-hydroxymethyldihydropteridine diphosphokinase